MTATLIGPLRGLPCTRIRSDTGDEGTVMTAVNVTLPPLMLSPQSIRELKAIWK